MPLAKFIDWLRYEKRAPGKTIRAYSVDITQFQEFLRDEFEGDLAAVQVELVRSWVVHLMDQGLKPSSISRKLSSLSSFYKFLRDEGLVKLNPVEQVKAPKKPQRLVRFIEEAEMVELLDRYSFGEGDRARKDQLILELLYGTGMRLSEMIGLKASDVDAEKVKVLGKGGKERFIPLNKELARKLGEHISTSGGNKNTTLFKTEKGKPLYPMYIYRLVKKYLSVVSTQTQLSPHVLRHSFATHLLNKGADINAIKELLGHANLSATEIYTHNSIERLKDVYKKSHPKA